MYYMVGKYIKETEFGNVWEVMGLFDSEEKALDVCKDHSKYFIGPLELNKQLPDKTVKWEGVYYPNELEK